MERSKILEDFQKSIMVCKWKKWVDIEDVILDINEHCYIIYINMLDMTCITDMYDHYLFLMFEKKGKCLLVPKKNFDKFRKSIKKLYRWEKEEAYQIGKELNKLYPDFNFFEIWPKKYKIFCKN